MWNDTDIRRLIHEVRSRPVLWEIRHRKSYKEIKQQWKEVAAVVSIDVHQCRRKWANLRDAYRALVRRCENHQQRDSKWIYYKDLSFIRENKRIRRKKRPKVDQAGQSICNGSTQNDNVSDLVEISEIKIELPEIGDEQRYSEDDDEDVIDRLYMEFEQEYGWSAEETNINSNQPQQNVKQTSAAVEVSCNDNKRSNKSFVPKQRKDVGTATTPSSTSIEAATQTTPSPVANEKSENCHCSARFQNLQQELRSLLKMTQTVTKSAPTHVNDPNFNFLVSFLPQLKQMNPIQNAEFRARMSSLVLNILMPTLQNETEFHS
uniref:MADF domain-containing protein n=1 Tax=Musca domestica TaxID=7370 RepID=A0A1I8NAL0_MUSDO